MGQGIGGGTLVGLGASLTMLPARKGLPWHLGVVAIGSGCGLLVDLASDVTAVEGKAIIPRDVVLQAHDSLRHVSTFYAPCDSNRIAKLFRQKHEWLVIESHSNRYYVVQKNPATGDVMLDMRMSLRTANDLGLKIAGRPMHTGEFRQHRTDMEFDIPNDVQVAYMIAWLRKEDPRWAFSTENSRQFTTRARYALNDF